MNNILIRTIVVIFLSTSLISCNKFIRQSHSCNVDTPENSKAKIYSLVANSWLKSGNYLDGKMVVIMQQTQNKIENDRNVSVIVENYGGIEKSLLEDFKIKNQYNKIINYPLNLPNNYKYISQNDFEEINKNNIYLLKKNPLTEKYPNAGGMIGFSNIGFNKDFTKAIVYSFNWYDSGSIFFLQQKNCQWEIANEPKNIWMH